MPDPNNIILPEHEIAFFGICKNANTSIKAAFLESQGVRSQHRVHDNSHFQYCTGAEIKASGLWSFAIVRNPTTRALSAWKNKCFRSWKDHYSKWGLARHMSFLEYCQAIALIPDEELTGAGQHFRSQLFEFRDHWPDFIIRFESLWDSLGWPTVQRMSKIELPELEHLNKSDNQMLLPGSDSLELLHMRYHLDYAEWYL